MREKDMSERPDKIWFVTDETKERRWVVLAGSEKRAISTVGVRGHPMGNMPYTPLSAVRLGDRAMDIEAIIAFGGHDERDHPLTYSSRHLNQEDYGVILCSQYPDRKSVV